jgi:hypothetical protein
MWSATVSPVSVEMAWKAGVQISKKMGSIRPQRAKRWCIRPQSVPSDSPSQWLESLLSVAVGRGSRREAEFAAADGLGRLRYLEGFNCFPLKLVSAVSAENTRMKSRLKSFQNNSRGSKDTNVLIQLPKPNLPFACIFPTMSAINDIPA